MIGAAFVDTLAAAQRGDDAAFARLWRDLHPSLLRYLRTMAGPSAEDVASETWLAVIGGLGRFKGPEPKFRAWVFTIARHKLVDATRRNRSDRSRPLETLTAPYEPLDPDAAEVAAERMATEQALALIATLPPDQAEIVLLRAVAGLDVADVAKVVGKSPGAVRVAAHRGLRALADRVTPAAADRVPVQPDVRRDPPPGPAVPSSDAQNGLPVTPAVPVAFRERDA